uniref:Uncharacterized protein n=1 Tax=Arundo donax TaxID=35708 RepID=A0A0A9A4S6_ARUDO
MHQLRADGFYVVGLL